MARAPTPAALDLRLTDVPGNTGDLGHSLMSAASVTVWTRMGGFSILTNRKRAIVALVHSVVFLMIAVRQMIAVQPAAGLWVASTVSRGTWILCGIFALVSVILLWLFVISCGWMEKFYFGLCTVSAASGLLRTAAGDQAFHAGLYLRVVMLVSAILVGLLIVREHSRTPSGVSVEYAEGGNS
ncbi:MAG: hypothetical protein LAO23_05020 [Acidobacteriia bacterium]|nr:hypothetical protein [Terriglobia bacterium]